MMNIQQAREASGFTRKEMADKFKIPYRTLQNWELGTRECPEWAERLIIKELEDYTMKELTETMLNDFVKDILCVNNKYNNAITYLDGVFDGYLNIKVTLQRNHKKLYSLLLHFVAQNNGIIVSTQPATYTTVIRVKDE